MRRDKPVFSCLGVAILALLAVTLGPLPFGGVDRAKAQDLNDSAIQSVEDIDGDAKRVVVKQGATWTARIDSGETFSDLLIDIDRPGASFRGLAFGSGWTIRNIGIKGTIKTDYAFALSGQNNTVEHVYVGDGAEPSRAKAFWVEHEDTEGPIDFRKLHISGFPNNGIYGSPTVEDIRGGVLNIYDSYFDSNNISNFKLGSPLGPCEVVDTVIRTDNPTTPINGQVNKRAMWALDNPGSGHANRHRVILRNVDIQGEIQAEPGAIVELQNTRWEGTFDAGDDVHESGDPDGELVGESAGTPDLSPPDGVPMTAREAATGDSGGDPNPEPEDPILTLPGLVESITVDGKLDEPDWRATEPSTFEDAGGDSDNTVEVRGLWDDQSLYLGWTVDDATVATEPSAAPHQEDAVELLLDPESNGGYELQPDDLQVIYSAAEKTKVTLDGQSSPEAVGLESAVRETDGGYVVELKVDWSPLGGAPETGDRFGALFANADRDDGTEAPQFAKPNIHPFKRPERFAPIEFLEADPDALPDDGTPNGDTGTGSPDAGDGDEYVDTGGGTTSPDTGASDDAYEDALPGPDTGRKSSSSSGANGRLESGCNSVDGSPSSPVLWLPLAGMLGVLLGRRR